MTVMAASMEAAGRSPLDCDVCLKEMTRPVRLNCQHCFCLDCISDRKCPTCQKPIEPTELKEDSVLVYVLESFREKTEVCANCDQMVQPMYFCETCQQPLCFNCKSSTHQARIFANHHIVDLEQCGRDRGRAFCEQHNEPYILFCLDRRELMCIECFNKSSIDKRHNFVNVEVAYKMCRSKLEKNTNKLKDFQEELREHIEVRKRVLEELRGNYQTTLDSVEQKSNEVIQKIVEMKNELLKRIESERQQQEEGILTQLQSFANLTNPIKLNLLSVSVFCPAASKIDLLHGYGSLIRNIQAILANKMERINFSSEVKIDYAEELLKSIEKALGWHTGLIPPPPPMPKCVVPNVATITPVVKAKQFELTKSRSVSPTGSYANYVAQFNAPSTCSSETLMPTLQRPSAFVPVLPAVGDFSGSFGDHFQRVDNPLRQLSIELACVSRNLIDIQRDITMRRCVVRKQDMESLVEKCDNLEQRVSTHLTMIDSLQPILREGWHEQLSRVRRQQNMFAQKMHDAQCLQQYARRCNHTALTLRPFAFYMASVIAVTDTRLSQSVELAPMERICQEITNIEPDSQLRIEAIEKEEEARRIAREAARIEEQHAVIEAKQSLKVTEKSKSRKKNSPTSVVVENSRDRSAVGNIVTRASKRRQKKESQLFSDDSSLITSTCSNGSTSPFEVCCSSPALSDASSIGSPLPPTASVSLPLTPVTTNSSVTMSPTTIFPVVPISVIPPPPPPPAQGLVVPIQSTVTDDRPATLSPPTMLRKPKLPAADSPSYETVLAREQLLEAIKERFKKLESSANEEDNEGPAC